MILICCAFLVVSGCSRGPSFDIAAKRDLKDLGLQILNHHSLGGKQSDLEAKSTEARKIIGSGNYVLLPGPSLLLTTKIHQALISGSVPVFESVKSRGGSD
jgi:hypothetical protein